MSDQDDTDMAQPVPSTMPPLSDRADSPAPPSEEAANASGGARRSLHEDIAERIRARILNASIRPGTKVPETQLCRELDVSRTPLREAIKVLAHEGLIQIRVNHGAIVTPINAGDIVNTAEVLVTLERLVGSTAADRISDEQIATIARLHAEMADAHRDGDRERYFMVNDWIHDQIYEATRNPQLANACIRLSTRIRHVRGAAVADPGWWDRSMSDHVQILDTLQRRDGAALGECLADHLQIATDEMIERVRDLD